VTQALREGADIPLMKYLRKYLGQEKPAQPTEQEVLINDDLPWFDRDFASRRVTQEVKDPWARAKIVELIEQGFTIIENGIDLEICDQAATEFLNWKKRNEHALPRFREADGRLMRIVNFHQTLPVLKTLFSRNRSLALQDYLFKKETALYTSLFYEQGSAQPIHRDIPLFWTYPASMYFGMWIALEDTDDENGPLEVIPGGHRIGLIDRGAIGAKRFNEPMTIPPMSNELWIDYQDEVARRADEKHLTKKKINVKKGDVILWHPLAPHGGAPIGDTSRTRLSFVMHTTPKGVPVFHMDVFFNPSRQVQKHARWAYSNFEGRAVAETGPMSIFGHGIEYDFSTLK
jgi:phytanoyl-CoA hydroxylase